MHIAILGSRGYPSTYGGFETFVRRLAPWLVAQGHEVTVFGRGGARHSVQFIDGVRVVETRGFESKSASTATHGVTAAIHCLRHKPDVVLALNVANGPAIPILKVRRIPVVMNVDGIEWQRSKWGWLARTGFRVGAWLSARMADRLVADSREIGRIWREQFGVDTEFIPYGGDIIEHCPDDSVRQLGLMPGSYALAVARLAPENNVELFLEALRVLEWSVPAVVVGSANYPNPIETELRLLHDQGRVLWLGHVADQDLLASLWAHAGVYFHGHSVGGTNPALLSALGCGAMTIAIDTPFNREVLGSEGLVPPDSTHIAREIRTIIDHPDLEGQRAEARRQLLVPVYEWDTVLRQYQTALIAAGRRTS